MGVGFLSVQQNLVWFLRSSYRSKFHVHGETANAHIQYVWSQTHVMHLLMLIKINLLFCMHVTVQCSVGAQQEQYRKFLIMPRIFHLYFKILYKPNKK